MVFLLFHALRNVRLFRALRNTPGHSEFSDALNFPFRTVFLLSLIHIYGCTVPLLTQLVLAEFMAAGHWQRHLRRIALSSKKIHDLLVNEIQNSMGSQAEIQGNKMCIRDRRSKGSKGGNPHTPQLVKADKSPYAVICLLYTSRCV